VCRAKLLRKADGEVSPSRYHNVACPLRGAFIFKYISEVPFFCFIMQISRTCCGKCAGRNAYVKTEGSRHRGRPELKSRRTRGGERDDFNSPPMKRTTCDAGLFLSFSLFCFCFCFFFFLLMHRTRNITGTSLYN